MLSNSIELSPSLSSSSLHILYQIRHGRAVSTRLFSPVTTTTTTSHISQLTIMGGWLSRLTGFLTSKPEIRVLILGLVRDEPKP